MNRMILTICVVALAVSLPVAAQQLEVNDAGGSLTSNGTNPTPGSPFMIPSEGQLDVDIAGAPASPYIFLAGSLAATSFATGIAGQFLDLDQGAPLLVVGDGFGGSAGALPAGFFATNSGGNSNFSIPANPALGGSSIAFQAIVQDPTLGAFPFNFTAAAEYTVVNGNLNTFSGDDTLMTFPLINPCTIYGVTFNDIAVSTNGWLKFGANATGSDLSESTADFINGNVGGGSAAPAIAVMWEDLDMGNGNAGQEVQVFESLAGIITVTWSNGDFFPATPFGTVSCTIDCATGQVTLDYSQYTAAAPPTEGIVGISDGGVASSTANEIDLVVAGVTTNFAPVNPAETVFQNFGTGAVSEAFDLGGVILNFVDVTFTGGYTLF